jgi:hypothetical protein
VKTHRRYAFGILFISLWMANAAAAVTYRAALWEGVQGRTDVDRAGYAWLWNDGGVVDLNPAAFFGSVVMDAWGSSQVGKGFTNDNHISRALLWHGSNSSVVDLHPSGFSSSEANALEGTSQVGFGSINDPDERHALLWHGTAESVVDLHPDGFDWSVANNVVGDTQYGEGRRPTTTFFSPHRALAWRGTAASVVDLTPEQFDHASISGASGSTQVGAGWDDDDYIHDGVLTHALLWRGTAENVVDLHPAGFPSSTAVGAAGDFQVGWGDRGTILSQRALLWRGSADTVVDLHSAVEELGLGQVASLAWAVNEKGEVFGQIYGLGLGYAVKWTPVPEPSAVSLFATAAICVAAMLRRRRVTQSPASGSSGQ